MTSRFRFTVLALAAAVSLAATACGSSGGSDGADGTTTTRAETTTSTVADAAGDGSDATDEEMMEGFLDQYRPGFELVFDDETSECVIDVFTEAALGDQSDEAILAAYEACGVSAQQVTGAMMAGELMSGGATDEQARCMSEAIGKLTEGELDTMDDVSGAALYEACGVDPASLDE